MTSSPKLKGHRKDSSIDDDAQIQAIADIMVSEPDLRPTDAIKRLGHEDQTTIRRLRGKYVAHRKTLLKAAAERMSAGSSPQAKEKRSPSRDARTAIPECELPNSKSARCDERPYPASPGIEHVFPWLSFATRCGVFLANEQARFYRDLARHPAMSMAFQQQAQMMSMMLGLYSASGVSSRRPSGATRE